MAKHQQAASQRWGFDFVRGKPLDDTKLFLWERVPPTNDYPEVYTLSRAAHIRHIEADHQMRSPSKQHRQYRTESYIDYIDLLDERSEQSNNHHQTTSTPMLDLSFEDVDAGHSSASSCDEESFDERNITHERLKGSSDNNSDSSILSDVTPIECNRQSDVRLTALPAITMSAPKTVPVAVASTSTTLTSVRRANSATATATTTTAQCNRTNCRATSAVSRNLRSSPRNREKRQPKITGMYSYSLL